MRTYTQQELDNLIEMPKEIVGPPKKTWVEERGHLRNDMALQSGDGQHDFTVFLRKNRDFPENFSVGLCYWPRETGKLIPLIRCNGPHGDFARTRSSAPHFRYHIHRIDAELLNSGKEPLATAMTTAAFASDREATRFFCQTTGIRDFERHFAVAEQLSLDNELDGGPR